MIGDRLRLARNSKGLSRKALASATRGEVSAYSIARYEHNVAMPNSTALSALVKALGVTHYFLLSQSGMELVGIELHEVHPLSPD
jgi:transcriptional regulator with XRE-family HTH domain